MCAIAGMLHLDAKDEILANMLDTMKRRGPDGNGIYVKDECTLLHARLAVIDPEGGKQPMIYNRGAEEYAIVYNGELYNTEEIRKELQKLGHRFRGYSDTEVVLHAYVQWKENCLDKMNGIFAFAVWETHTHRLFLARDRMGVKPLFYSVLQGGLIFASEIKTILAHPAVERNLDANGVGQILLLGPGRVPGSGVFRDVCELEPGTFAFFYEGKLRLFHYWSLKDREHTDSFAQTVDKVRFLVTDSIKRQMVSDVPLGCFLSGGLDSSIISAVCAREMTGKGMRLSTFSVDYQNNDLYFKPEKFQPNSDSQYIKLMAEKLDSHHSYTVLSAQDLLDALQQATIARDLPGMADVDFSLLQFCGDIRKKVTVSLSGECADEIFGGYPWYRDPEVRAMEGFPWAQNTKYRALFLSGEYAGLIDAESFVREYYRQTILSTDILPGTDPQERRMKEMVNLNYRWFMQTLLDRKDRMSMYQSLEVRVPFCDYRIAEYMYGVPWEYKDYQGKEKGLLRMAISDLLPDQVLWRKKSPYPKTYDPAYLQLVSNCLKEIISDPSAPILQIVSREALENLLKSEYLWPWYGQLMRVPQTIAFMLQINFWLSEYKIRLV